VSGQSPAAPDSGTPQKKPPRYWKGYDTVEADLVNIRELLAKSRAGEYRDGWWRFYAVNKIEGPFLLILAARARGVHVAFKTVWTAKHPRGQRWCTCGLIVPARDTPEQTLNPGSSSYVLDPCWPDDSAHRAQVEATFLAADGHLGRESISEDQKVRAAHTINVRRL
jgi:hypothetical protein